MSESAWEEMTCLFAPSLGNAYSELRTDTAGESWVKVKATTGDKTLEKELTVWVVENHQPNS
ncbi:hypothetical protein ACTM5L_21365 [Citrobacter freundii]